MNNSKPLLIIQKSHNFKDDRITMKSVDVYSPKNLIRLPILKQSLRQLLNIIAGLNGLLVLFLIRL